jgi:hypothetical protein
MKINMYFKNLGINKKTAFAECKMFLTRVYRGYGKQLHFGNVLDIFRTSTLKVLKFGFLRVVG